MKITMSRDLIINYSLEGSEELKEAVRDFIEFRKEKKKPLTARGFELFIRKLEKLASDEETKIKIIEQSIENSWTGVFPLHFDAEESVRAKVKPSGFNNFYQRATDFDEVRRKKRESLMQKAEAISQTAGASPCPTTQVTLKGAKIIDDKRNG